MRTWPEINANIEEPGRGRPDGRRPTCLSAERDDSDRIVADRMTARDGTLALAATQVIALKKFSKMVFEGEAGDVPP